MTTTAEQLIAVRAAIAKAETAQEYTDGGRGGGFTVKRGDLAALYKREEALMRRQQMEDGNGGSMSTVGQIFRPS